MSEYARPYSRLALERLTPRGWETPAQWAQRHLDLSPLSGIQNDFWNPADYPYTVEPLNAFDYRGERKEITVLAPEQTGKTILWIAGYLWLLKAIPSPNLIIYPDDELCRRINSGKVLPLMRKIPELKTELDIPNAAQRDHYAFSDSVTYYSGSGSPITSLSCRVVIADELDTWVVYEGREHPFSGAQKRSRSFNSSLFVDVCTPKGTASESIIYSRFLESSKKFFYLRCCGCGELTLRSCDIHNLQFELDGEDRLIEDSLRLICPKCHREHVESEKRAMIQNGGYIAEHPELAATHDGYQWGALVSCKPALSWAEIARAQLKAGDTGTLHDRRDFYNSIRGLPLKTGTVAGKRETKFLSHRVPRPDPKDFIQRWASVDVQDDCLYWIVRGITKKLDSYLIECGKALTSEELSAAVARLSVNFGIIDTGGHRTREVYQFIAAHRGWLGYKGNSHIGTPWKVSDTSNRLILADPKFYKSELLGLIYPTHESKHGKWYLPPEVPDEYRDQILNMAPNKKVKNGNSFENWDSDGYDHFFDAEKMLLVFRDYWNRAILPVFLKSKQKI